MKAKAIEIVNGIIGSFSNDTTGFAAKKLSIFALMVTYIWCHKFVSKDNLEMVLTIDSALIVALFTVNVVDKYKNPLEKHSPNESSEDKKNSPE